MSRKRGEEKPNVSVSIQPPATKRKLRSSLPPTQLEQLLFGDELVVVVDGGGAALLQLLCEAVQEGGPPRGRTQARHVEHLRDRCRYFLYIKVCGWVALHSGEAN